jgi:hypothetical protein
MTLLPLPRALGLLSVLFFLAACAGDPTLLDEAQDLKGIGESKDRTPPVTAITSPPAGSMLSTGSSSPVTASASDNVGVTRVDFYTRPYGSDLATLLGSASLPPYSVTWTRATFLPGGYYLSSCAFDAAGNSATSAEVLVSVWDSIPPVVKLVSPSQGDVLEGGSVTVTAEVTDNWGINSVQFIAFWSGAVTVSGGTSPYSATFSTAGAGEGPWTILVNAWDREGINANDSIQVTISQKH